MKKLIRNWKLLVIVFAVIIMATGCFGCQLKHETSIGKLDTTELSTTTECISKPLIINGGNFINDDGEIKPFGNARVSNCSFRSYIPLHFDGANTVFSYCLFDHVLPDNADTIEYCLIIIYDDSGIFYPPEIYEHNDYLYDGNFLESLSSNEGE